MKKGLLTALILAGLPLMGQDDVSPGPPPPPHGDHSARKARPPRLDPEVMGMLIMGRQLLMERYDKDGDGRLSPEERKAVAEDLKKRTPEIIALYDTDGDGKLSPEELTAAKAKWLDKNPDLETRVISIARQIMPRREGATGSPPRDSAAGRENVKPGPDQGEAGPPRPRHRHGFGPLGMLGVRDLKDPVLIAVGIAILDKYDADKDGILSTGELNQWIADGKVAMEKRRQEMVKRRQEIINKYDKDGDGKLSREESQAMREDRRKQRAREDGNQ